MREEQFGPVLPVLSYTDVDDAIRRANDTDYGLGGTVWSSDPKRAQEVAMKIDSGIVWVNSHMNVSPLVGTGGAKQSGMGVELGVEGWRNSRSAICLCGETDPMEAEQHRRRAQRESCLFRFLHALRT